MASMDGRVVYEEEEEAWGLAGDVVAPYIQIKNWWWWWWWWLFLSGIVGAALSRLMDGWMMLGVLLLLGDECVWGVLVTWLLVRVVGFLLA